MMPEPDVPPEDWTVADLFDREPRRAGPTPVDQVAERPAGVPAFRPVDLERLLRELPEGIAAAVVEMSSGSVLASATLGGHSGRDFDFLAAATSGIFEDATVTSIELMDLEHPDAASNRRSALRQVIVVSEHTLYIFLRSRRSPDLVLATLCRANVNLGIALMTARDWYRTMEGPA